QLVDRLAARLPEQVPEGDVDGGAAAGLDPGPAEAEERVEPVPVPLDLERVLAQEVACGALVHPRGDGTRAERRLSEPHEALVGVEADVREVRELLQEDRL